ncbi:hypothetical protein [Streptomyces cinereoruber]|uniref:hypothetical protein n=1 Tax=Streptomyces cinereoruber TaxID=67260 RepID=UPI00364362BE
MPTRRVSRHNSKGIRRTSTKSAAAYRALIHWPTGTSTTYDSHDRARILAIAQKKATAGATVEFQEHQGWCTYKTTRILRPDTPQE